MERQAMEAGVSGWRERRRITIDAGDLVRLGEAVTKAKEKFCWKGGWGLGINGTENAFKP
jgi:hypothetical protein